MLYFGLPAPVLARVYCQTGTENVTVIPSSRIDMFSQVEHELTTGRVFGDFWRVHGDARVRVDWFHLAKFDTDVHPNKDKSGVGIIGVCEDDFRILVQDIPVQSESGIQSEYLLRSVTQFFGQSLVTMKIISSSETGSAEQLIHVALSRTGVEQLTVSYKASVENSQKERCVIVTRYINAIERLRKSTDFPDLIRQQMAATTRKHQSRCRKLFKEMPPFWTEPFFKAMMMAYLRRHDFSDLMIADMMAGNMPEETAHWSIWKANAVRENGRWNTPTTEVTQHDSDALTSAPRTTEEVAKFLTEAEALVTALIEFTKVVPHLAECAISFNRPVVTQM